MLAYIPAPWILWVRGSPKIKNNHYIPNGGFSMGKINNHLKQTHDDKLGSGIILG